MRVFRMSACTLAPTNDVRTRTRRAAHCDRATGQPGPAARSGSFAKPARVVCLGVWLPGICLQGLLQSWLRSSDACSGIHVGIWAWCGRARVMCRGGFAGGACLGEVLGMTVVAASSHGAAPGVPRQRQWGSGGLSQFGEAARSPTVCSWWLFWCVRGVVFVASGDVIVMERQWWRWGACGAELATVAEAPVNIRPVEENGTI